MARMRTSSALELLVPLDRDGPEPLHRQLEQGIREAVRSGRLAAGTALPSTRALAAQLAVSRGIVVEAYEQLGAEGYLATTPGGVTRGCDQVAAAARPSTPGAGHRLRRRLPAGPARPRPLPARDLAALGQAGARHRPEPAARLSRRARDARAARCPGRLPQSRPGHGRGRRFDRRLLRVRAGPQAGRPGPARPRRPSDRHRGPDPAREPRGPARDRPRGRRDPGRRSGMRVERARRRPRPGRGASTAAHQYPTGGVLPPDRRAALMAWAERRGGLVIEDDYDAEFRYDREPIGAMQGLSPDRVVYAGSASKILAPGLRLGWIVVPAELADRSPRPRRRPTSVRPRSTSSPSPTSSPMASSTATCAGCGRSTGRAGTSCWRLSAGTCPSFGPSAHPPGCTSSPGCRPTSTRSRSSRRQGAAGSASRASDAAGHGRSRPPGRSGWAG